MERAEWLMKPRLAVPIAERAKRRAVTAGAALLALTFYPLAFVPVGVNAPAAGVGLMARDGLLILIGYAASAAAVYVLFNFL